MTPIGLTILIVLILLILIMPRDWAALSVIAGVIYLTSGQQLFIEGVNFFAMRFIEVAGFARIIIRKEFSFAKLNAIDKSFLLFQCVFLSVFLIRSIIDPSSIETRFFRIGYFCDGVMSYFIFRGLLSDQNIFRNFLKKCALLISPFALFMIVEALTGSNLFSFMGGVPAIPVLRDGYYRAQGSFGVAITAGSFGATLFPLFIYLFFLPEGRILGVIGSAACLAITIASHSSGPSLAFVAGVIAWLCWPWRKSIRLVRWCIVFLLIFLHLVMKAPVWFIFNRLSDVFGGDGWHRSNLIDQFITHFNDWGLMGMSLERTANWAATRLENGAVDVTNEYVSLGISAGLITLFLFIVFLVICYQALGKGMHLLRRDAPTQPILSTGPLPAPEPRGWGAGNRRQDELLLWAIGCVLFTHLVNISAVRYWDQLYVIWYMSLAVTSSMTACLLSQQSIVNADKGQTVNGYFTVDNRIPLS